MRRRGFPLPRGRFRGAELQVSRDVPTRLGGATGRTDIVGRLQSGAAGTLPAGAGRSVLCLLLDAEQL